MCERLIGKDTIVRHFKHKWYKIITVAQHTEDNSELVVYKALYGAGLTYARPKEMFTSKVDRLKYPDVKQEYRFEVIDEILDTKIDEDDYLKQLIEINTAIESNASDEYIAKMFLVLENQA